MTIIVIEDFYDNPDEVREFALKQNFVSSNKYPAYRGGKLFNEENVRKIENAISPFTSGIHSFVHANAIFQLGDSRSVTWIHTDIDDSVPDNVNVWGGVVYLTPNAYTSAGTAFFKHKETQSVGTTKLTHKQDNEIYKNDVFDYTKWEKTDVIANYYNRAVLFTSNLFHAANGYFGKNKETARLTQTFFFFTLPK